MNNYMKIIINAIKLWVNEKFAALDEKISNKVDNKLDSITAELEGATNDWNELKNRPFYEEYGEHSIVYDGNTDGLVSIVSPVDDSEAFYKISDLKPTVEELTGATILIELDDDEYEPIVVGKNGEVVMLEDGSLAAIGADNVGALYLIVYKSGIYNLDKDIQINIQEPGVYIVKVTNVVRRITLTYNGTMIHPVDIKYIPDAVTKNADFDQNNAMISDYIKNRTHWREQNRIVIDESTSRLDPAFSYNGIDYYKVSDYIPYNLIRSITALYGGYSNEKYGDYHEEYEFGWSEFYNDIISINDCDAFYNYINDANNFETYRDLPPGLYFCDDLLRNGFKALSIIYYTYKPLSDHYIPDTIARVSDLVKNGGNVIISEDGTMNVEVPTSYNDLTDRPFYEENNQTVIEWDGNIDGRESIEPMSVYKVSDIIPSASELIGAEVVVKNGNETGHLVITEEYIQDVGVGILHIMGGAIWVLNITDADREEMAAEEVYYPSNGVLFLNTGETVIQSLTYGSSTIVPIDEKYIPASIARVSDIPILPEIPEINYPVTSVNGQTGDVVIEIPSTEGLATEEYVNNAITNINTYYTKAEIDNMEFITLDEIDAICARTIEVVTPTTGTF